MRQLLAVTAAAAERIWDIVAPVIVAAVTAGGALLIKWLRARRKRIDARSAARAKDRALLYAEAELLLALDEELLFREWATNTGRFRLQEGEIAERRGAYRERKREAVELLRRLLEVTDRRVTPRDTQRFVIDQPQDVLREEDLTEEERQR